MIADESQTSDTLAEQFEKAWSIFKLIEDSDLPSNDSKYQENVKQAVHLLEKSTEMVNYLGLFSPNETLDDVSTQSLKYLLLPAFLGYFTSRMISKPRKEIIQIAEIYFKDFLKRIKSYQVCPVDLNLETDSESENVKSLRIDLEQMARDRQKKIEAYKRQKEIERKFSELEAYLKQSKADVDDDEKYREYYLILIKMWVGKAIDELTSIEREKPLLDRAPIRDDEQKLAKKTPPLKPFIITRTDMQKKVYGLGYPSLPTMTIEEFAESKIKEGSLSVTQPSQANSLMEWARNPDLKKNQEEVEASQKEIAEEREDKEALIRAREWDEFKDDNKKGWGNRHNRS